MVRGKKLYDNLIRFQRVVGEAFSKGVNKKADKGIGEKENRRKYGVPNETKDFHNRESFVNVKSYTESTRKASELLHKEGYFALKVTPLGENLCLLEEDEEGELEALVEGAFGWLSQWFSEVRKWRAKDVDIERLT
ncbi:unnamed protein product [Lathyrus sativus]|nr:unnamed protein product [Lathyrus sativus]